MRNIVVLFVASECVHNTRTHTHTQEQQHHTHTLVLLEKKQTFCYEKLTHN